NPGTEVGIKRDCWCALVNTFVQCLLESLQGQRILAQSIVTVADVVKQNSNVVPVCLELNLERLFIVGLRLLEVFHFAKEKTKVVVGEAFVFDVVMFFCQTQNTEVNRECLVIVTDEGICVSEVHQNKLDVSRHLMTLCHGKNFLKHFY